MLLHNENIDNKYEQLNWMFNNRESHAVYYNELWPIYSTNWKLGKQIKKNIKHVVDLGLETIKQVDKNNSYDTPWQGRREDDASRGINGRGIQ